MRWLLPTLSLLAALVSLLNLVRAPDYMWAWKLAILIGEFGHWLVLLPLGLAVLAGCGSAGAARILTLVLCAGATAGFLRPVFTARRLAAALPAGLHAAFGGAAPPLALDCGRLYHGRAVPAAGRRTEVFARPGGQELRLDFYRPGAAKDGLGRPRPCVIVIHGGGWDGGGPRAARGLE